MLNIDKNTCNGRVAAILTVSSNKRLISLILFIKKTNT